MVELTIPLETGAQNAGAMKQIMNAELVDSTTQDSNQASLTTIEFSSTSFIHVSSCSQINTIVSARPKLRMHLEKEVSRQASEGSFRIRCRINKREEN